jgi:hypothetical protein
MHIEDQQMDRVVGDRISKLAAVNIMAPEPPVNDANDILDQTIDAMEQAKFKLPREGPTGQSKACERGACESQQNTNSQIGINAYSV